VILEYLLEGVTNCDYSDQVENVTSDSVNSAETTATATATTTPSPAASIPCDPFIQSLKDKGIQLLGIDFDKTFINYHTQGYYSGNMNDLVQYVNPCFRELFPKALEGGNTVKYNGYKIIILIYFDLFSSLIGLYVCMATFYRDARKLKQLMAILFGEEISNKVMKTIIRFYGEFCIPDHLSLQ